jgi:hypothetical protein
MSANRHRSYKSRFTGKHRDAKLFIIATEDTNAPRQYFSIFRKLSSRLDIVVCETTDGLSSPRHVIERLIEYKRQADLQDDDQLWALLDTDHWITQNHIAGLSAAHAYAKMNGIRVAMSNPCFDLWLMLHHLDLPSQHNLTDANEVLEHMREQGIAFNKQNLNLADYTPAAIQAAMDRAKRIPGTELTGWPQSTGTQVHYLMTELRKAGIRF